MIHPTLDTVQRHSNGVRHPSQLVHDLDVLMDHLDAVQPEHERPRTISTIEAHPAKAHPPRLWERLKNAARNMAHPHDRHADQPTLKGDRTVHQSVGPQDPPPMLEHGQPVASAVHARVFSVNGHGIRQRADGLYCLNDLLHASGVPRLNRSPRSFLKRARTLLLLGALGREHPGTRWVETEKARRRGGGTVAWGRRELMLEYASWLCPRFLHAVLDVLCAHEAPLGASVQKMATCREARGSTGMVELPSSRLMTELPDILKTHYVEESSPKGAAKATPTAFTHRMSVDLGASLDKVTITSGEIAELVNSRHEDVRRSIERLVKKGVVQEPPMAFSEKINNLGLSQKIRHYVFSGEQGKRDSIIVVAQLSPEFTARLVDRWMELERHAAIGAFGVPQTLQDALRMSADLLDENQALKLENQSLKQLAGPVNPEKSGQAGGAAGGIDLSSACTVSELAKTLGLGRNLLCGLLRDEGLLLKTGTNHTPANRHLRAGLFAFRPYPNRKASNAAPHMQLVVTEKGQAHIQQRLAERGLLPL